MITEYSSNIFYVRRKFWKFYIRRKFWKFYVNFYDFFWLGNIAHITLQLSVYDNVYKRKYFWTTIKLWCTYLRTYIDLSNPALVSLSTLVQVGKKNNHIVPKSVTCVKVLSFVWSFYLWRREEEMIRRWEKSFSNLSIDVNHSFFAPSVGGRGRFKKKCCMEREWFSSAWCSW